MWVRMSSVTRWQPLLCFGKVNCVCQGILMVNVHVPRVAGGPWWLSRVMSSALNIHMRDRNWMWQFSFVIGKQYCEQEILKPLLSLLFISTQSLVHTCILEITTAMYDICIGAPKDVESQSLGTRWGGSMTLPYLWSRVQYRSCISPQKDLQGPISIWVPSSRLRVPHWFPRVSVWSGLPHLWSRCRCHDIQGNPLHTTQKRSAKAMGLLVCTAE